jgi:hypothetical protein
MKDSERKGERDAFDAALSNLLRLKRPKKPVPAPREGEPSDELLLLYIDGQLEADEKNAVERLLATHPYSSDRVEIVERALAEDGDLEQQPSIARLVFAVHKSAANALSYLRGTADLIPLAPAAVAVRSASTVADSESASSNQHHFFRFKQRFYEVSADITVEHARIASTSATARSSTVASGDIDLRVCLSDDAGAVGEGRVSLRREGQLLSSVRLRDGSADFSGLEPASYLLELKRQGTVVGEVALDFLQA